MTIKRRLIAISTLTFIGAILFIPFLIVSDSTLKGAEVYKTSILFVFLSIIVVLLTAWGGLRFSDKLNLKMPILRNWEINGIIKSDELKSTFLNSILIGAIVAGLALIGNYFMKPPINPGDILTRISTTLWASVLTETVSHLFVLSGLILLIKNKWISLIISGLFFVVLFHLNSNYDTNTTLYLGVVNFLAATVTGYLFITKGFEYAVLTHMTMHFILLAVNK